MSIPDLIERVSGASGEDRETDAHIFATFNKSYDGDEIVPAKSLHVGEKMQFAIPSKPRRAFYILEEYVPRYTSDIGTAIALLEAQLPEANCYGFDKSPTGVVAYVSRNNVTAGHWLIEGEHKNPALALLLAFLKAKQATP